MAKLQDAWQSLVDRFRNDQDFNDFFSQFFIVKTTEQITTPYCLLRPGTMEFIPAATFGTNLTNEVDATFSGELVTQDEDDELAVNRLFQAQEVFMNAFDDTDITHGSKFQGDFIVTFGEVTPLEGQENLMSWPFTITGKIQPYNAGDL